MPELKFSLSKKKKHFEHDESSHECNNKGKVTACVLDMAYKTKLKSKCTL
jgi:hypothetical protein